MSTAFDKKIPHGADQSHDFVLPPCSIEDVDRAVFKLFDEQLPLVYKQKEDVQRVPVIFGTGERFAILRRKVPLRDRSGALVIPLISVIRTGIDQKGKAYGISPGDGELIIKKQISPDDPRIQEFLNQNLSNQDNAPSSNNLIGTDDTPLPGKTAIRGEKSAPSGTAKINTSFSGRSAVEVFTIKSPRFYTASYEITLWAQYQQQMNDMLEAVMLSYTHNASLSFKLESDKGYWFVGYCSSAISSQSNLDDYTDDERIIKHSFTMDVNGYLIGANAPGVPSGIKRYVSAPHIQFVNTLVSGAPDIESPAGPPSGDPDDYFGSDLDSQSDPLPGGRVAGTGLSGDSAEFAAAVIGGHEAANPHFKIIKMEVDPLTGERRAVKVNVKTKNDRHGETVFRELS